MSQHPVREDSKIGEILVEKGYVRQSDIDRAVAIQQKEFQEKDLLLGELLVKERIISRAKLHTLLEHPYLRKDLGKIALERKLVTPDQLKKILSQKQRDEPVDELIVRTGVVKGKELEDLKQRQLSGISLGDLALKLNMVDETDLARVVAIKGSIRSLGEILCDLKLISPADLNLILKQHNKALRLGGYLVARNLISSDDLNDALKLQKHGNRKLGEILVSQDLITEEQLYTALSRLNHIAFRKLDNFSFKEEEKDRLVGLISQRYAHKNRILPLSLKNEKLVIAISNPSELGIISELNVLYGQYSPEFVLITDKKFEPLFRLLYGKSHLSAEEDKNSSLSTDKLEGITLNLSDDSEMDKAASDHYGYANMEVEEVVNYIIKYGIVNNASDIHIEQDKSMAKIRYRIDGILRVLNLEWLDRILQANLNSIISRIKILSKLDISERRKPQDGVFRINYHDSSLNKTVDLDFRVAVCPAIVGENVTIRILDSRKANVGIANLGHGPHVLRPFRKLLKSSSGIVIVCGPTGSGKSSTLYGALQYIHHPGIKIITAEDPIEYSISGVMQCQVNVGIGVSFSTLLRSFLRFDPDVILVGEMRDGETAAIGFDAAQTGHLLLSTLHTNDAVGAIPRLLDLHIERNQISNSLLCVVAQRLIRRLCEGCKSRYIPDEKEWSMLFPTFPADLEFFKANGCQDCDYSGFKGRTILSELFVVDQEIAQAIKNGEGVKTIQQLAIGKGMRTMIDDGVSKLDQTTLSEIIRVSPHEAIKEFQNRGRAGEEASFDGDSEFVIHDPAAEMNIIDMMYIRYLKLNHISPEDREDRDLFRRFIRDNHGEISRKYSCGRVCFRLRKGGDGKVAIQSVPQP
ncbi:MAG: Flp pilus assembly complex ATPase component [Desulfobacteraceae bacterium]|nr:Flp pilus assembly complex ATPase component [Desulfobacteraceae bacterium]